MADERFLSRWSKRKADARAGKPVEQEPIVQERPASPVPAPVAAAPVAEPQTPPPTLEEAQSLTFDSDFKRFVTPDVAPEVKNAAVKKLFADPRFNVRDMMDVYADDYSQPDPLPESMLRQLAAAKVLGLFEADAGTAENADDAVKKSVAQSSSAPEAVPEPSDADPDLRLQQDDAPAGASAGDGIERAAAAAHDPVPPPGERVPEGDQR
jgi:hypothetical protein